MRTKYAIDCYYRVFKFTAPTDEASTLPLGEQEIVSTPALYRVIEVVNDLKSLMRNKLKLSKAARNTLKMIHDAHFSKITLADDKLKEGDVFKTLDGRSLTYVGLSVGKGYKIDPNVSVYERKFLADIAKALGEVIDCCVKTSSVFDAYIYEIREFRDYFYGVSTGTPYSVDTSAKPLIYYAGILGDAQLVVYLTHQNSKDYITAYSGAGKDLPKPLADTKVGAFHVNSNGEYLAVICDTVRVEWPIVTTHEDAVNFLNAHFWMKMCDNDVYYVRASKEHHLSDVKIEQIAKFIEAACSDSSVKDVALFAANHINEFESFGGNFEVFFEAWGTAV